LNNKSFWYSSMAGCVVGWAFVVSGLLCPFAAGSTLKTTWLVITIVLMTHFLELPKAIPIGKQAGASLQKTVVYTIIFGLTWWMPVQRGIIKG